MEKLMMSIMYDIPSQADITDVVVTEDCVYGKAEPIITRKELIAIDAEAPALKEAE